MLGGVGRGWAAHTSHKNVFSIMPVLILVIVHIGLIWSDFVEIAHPPGHCLQQV